MSSPIVTIEYKGALIPKKKADLQEIATAMEINPIPSSKLDIIESIKQALVHNESTWKSDPRFTKLYEKGGRGRQSTAVRDSTPGGSSSGSPTTRDESNDHDDDEHVPSSHSPEDHQLHPSSSSSYNTHSGGGIPKGRELPRSPIKQVTDSLPSLAIPGSVKKLASSIFARPVAVAEENVQALEEREQEQDQEQELAQGRRASLRVAKKAKEVVEEVEEEVESGVVVAVDQAEVLITKAKGFWEEKVWTPSGRILSTQSTQTFLLLLLELLPLLLTTLIFKTFTLTLPPSIPTLSQPAPIAGEYNISPPPHVLTNHNVNHPWINVDLRVIDFQASFKGWDANQRFLYPFAAWGVLTVLGPAVLALLIGSKNNAGGKTLVFHILRLGVWGALATQVGGGGGGEASGWVVNSLRGTGLAGGLGVVASGVGVLLGLANALGA